LIKRRLSIIIFIGIFISNNLFSKNELIEIETFPSKKISFSSIVIFPFEGKLINSGRYPLVDYLEISNNLYKHLLIVFSKESGVIVCDADKMGNLKNSDKISVVRGKKIIEYDEKSFKDSEVKRNNITKSVEAYLYGKITKFYTGRDFLTSYIEVTVYLVDSKSKIIYWTSNLRGCVKYVIDALKNIIISGEYHKPLEGEIEEFKWANPYEIRFKNFAIGWSIGYFNLLGDMNGKVENKWANSFSFGFKMPIFYKVDIYNQIEVSLINSLKLLDESTPFYNYTFFSYFPISLNFYYDFKRVLKLKRSYPYPWVRLGVGVSYDRVYFSGQKEYIEPQSEVKSVLIGGIGGEYNLFPFDIGSYHFAFDRLSLIMGLNYYKWIDKDVSLAFFNFQFGIKYYFK